MDKLTEKNRTTPGFESIWPAVKLKAGSEDAAEWGGWYSRHGGQIQYVGDHISGTLGEGAVASSLLGLLAGLILALIQGMSSGRRLRKAAS